MSNPVSGAVRLPDGSTAGPAAAASLATPIELDAEDAKLVTLARGARGRAAADEGAAVRDDDGRTYAAATVNLPSLKLTAAQAAVAAAVSSGANALEALAVVGGRTGLDPASAAAARDLGTAIVVIAATDGSVLSRTRA
ncbi:MAG: cytidine deaminase [Nakamurella sp.]